MTTKTKLRPCRIAVCLCCITACTTACVSADDPLDIQDGVVENCYQDATTITVPATYDGESVTSIGEAAFQDCQSLTDLTLDAEIVTIGDYAFQNCSALTEITLPDSVTTIGEEAFAGCTSLESITLSENLTTISENAFESCVQLTEIAIPESVTSIAVYAFYTCENLTTVYYAGTEEAWEALDLDLYTFPATCTIVYESDGVTEATATT